MPESTNSIAQALWKWLRQCPALTQGVKVGVDYLSDKAQEYAIYAVPSTIRTTENVLGEVSPAARQQQTFYFASKEPYGADARQTMQNQHFYEAVIAWIWEQNRLRNLPSIPGGSVISLVPTLTPMIADASADTARYQIQLQLTYRRYD